MPRWLRSLLIGVATGLCGAALVITPVGTEFEKNVGLPWLFKVRGPIEPPPEVAVVAIDGSTGRTLDLPRLPRDWPRTVHAQRNPPVKAVGQAAAGIGRGCQFHGRRSARCRAG